ncbi:ABC-2 transporter permease [Lachnospiraceae bacterium 42-17]
MKAMLIKDVNLLKGQKQFFGALLVMIIIFSGMQSDPTFSITYTTLMFAILTMTTMSYDDFENGMCYLLTLPVSRREYVTEKYVFGVLSSLCGCTGASFVAVSAGYIKGIDYPWEEWTATVVSCMLLLALVLAVTTPIQLKFGSEKSRMAVFGVFAFGSLAVFVIVKLCQAAGIDMDEVMKSALIENLTTTAWGICITAAIVLAVSWLISVRILEKREF